MDDFTIQEVIDSVIINEKEENIEVIETSECNESIFIIKFPLIINTIEHSIFQKVLDDGMRFFKNPFNDDAIDLEDNTPVFNSILNQFIRKGVSQHSAAHLTPIVFDHIADIAFNTYKEVIAKNKQEYRLSDFIRYFEINEDDAYSIAKLIARNEATTTEKEMLAQYIYLLSPHSLFNEPIEYHFGEWKLITSPDRINKDEFRKGLLMDLNKEEDVQKSLF